VVAFLWLKNAVIVSDYLVFTW